jgi:hypothetical protein
MTPEERNQVTELFERLATLEENPRDREAERLIQDGLRYAPNAPYSMVQTVLIQDEALKRADNRIRELETQLGTGGQPPRQGGFLESMREGVFGKRAGSVPTVRPGGEQPMGAPPGYQGQGQPMAQQPMPQQPMGQPMAQPSAGGSFLGTAAAAAVGVVGGALLANSIRGMMTGNQGGGQAHAAFEPPGGGGQGTPWGGSGGDGNLGRDLGVNDIGRSSGSGGGAPRSQGLVDSDSNETADATPSDANYVSNDDPSYAADQNDVPEFDDSENDFGGDLGGDDGGGSDE